MKAIFLEEYPLVKTEMCMFVCGGGERSGSVGSIGSVRSSSSLQNSGNTHVLTTPAPSPHPANTPGVNTHGLNAPGLHTQAEGVKVRESLHLFVCMCILLLDLYKTTTTLFLGNSKTFSGNKSLLTKLTTILFPAKVVLPLERSASLFIMSFCTSPSLICVRFILRNHL